MGAGFLEPVGHQVGAAGDSARVGFAQGLDVAVSQLPAHHLVAQKRRVAHDHIGPGPFGFRAIGVEQGIPMLDAVQRLQDGVGGVLVAIASAPLDVADPDGDAGQFGGIFIDFQTENVVWAGHEHD